MRLESGEKPPGFLYCVLQSTGKHLPTIDTSAIATSTDCDVLSLKPQVKVLRYSHQFIGY